MSRTAQQGDAMNEITRLESRELVVRVFEDGTFAAGMKTADCQWLPDPWQRVPCRVTLERVDAGRLTVDVGGAGECRVSSPV